MKKILLSGAMLFLGVASIIAQTDSDDPIYNNLVPAPVSVSLAQAGTLLTKTIIVGGMTINGEILPCDSTNTTLTAADGSCGYHWYSDSLGANVISTGIGLSLSGITGDTIVYVSEAIAAFDSLLPMPPHSSTYSGNVRGYWFQAPMDLIITGATVPLEASTGSSNIAILKFDTAAPPLWAGTTNAFTVLGLWQNEIADTVFLCAAVDSGEWIGVLGNRTDNNSYAPAPYMSSINGIPTLLNRMGMQQTLSANAPANIFSESAGSISRVVLIYGSPTPTGPIYPVPVVGPLWSSSVSVAMSICFGDSTLLGGAMQTVSGIYTDTLAIPAFNGCDSLINTTLTVEPQFTSSDSVDVCIGDSIMINGIFISTNGTYLDSLTSVGGCDSLATLIVDFVAISSSSETVDLCAGDSIMINGAFVTTNGTYVDTLASVIGCDSLATLIVDFMVIDGSATQSGLVLTASNGAATYQWVDCNNGNSAIIGETGQSYTAIANGSYAVQVTENGCTAMSACFDYTTIGINEHDLGATFIIYPNPTDDIVNYSFIGTNTMDFVLTNVAGQILWVGSSTSNQGTIDLSTYAAGTYLLDVSNGDKRATIRLVKK